MSLVRRGLSAGGGRWKTAVCARNCSKSSCITRLALRAWSVSTSLATQSPTACAWELAKVCKFTPTSCTSSWRKVRLLRKETKATETRTTPKKASQSLVRNW
jgi:hypothetical protein